MNFVMSGVSAHTTMSNMWTSSGVKKCLCRIYLLVLHYKTTCDVEVSKQFSTAIPRLRFGKTKGV